MPGAVMLQTRLAVLQVPIAVPPVASDHAVAV